VGVPVPAEVSTVSFQVPSILPVCVNPNPIKRKQDSKSFIMVIVFIDKR
jgi:hypothetical protein